MKRWLPLLLALALALGCAGCAKRQTVTVYRIAKEGAALLQTETITVPDGTDPVQVMIDALGAVLGQRTSRELIRTGAEKAFVSATFSAVPADLPGLAENGFTPEEDGTLLLQRELYGDGKNVCRVGGRPVTVAQLKRIGASLLNIHGQHDGQQLLDEEQHLVYLDRFGRVENELAAYCTRYDVMKETRRAIDALKMDEAEKARRVDAFASDHELH